MFGHYRQSQLFTQSLPFFRKLAGLPIIGTSLLTIT